MLRGSVFSSFLSRSDTTASLIHTFILVHRLCGKQNYIEDATPTKLKNFGNSLYSVPSICRNLQKLEELNYIKRDKNKITVKESDYDKGSLKYSEEGFIDLNTKFIDRILSSKELKDSEASLRFALEIYREISSNFFARKKYDEKVKSGYINRRTPLKYFSEKIKNGVSRRTVSRVIKALKDISLIKYNVSKKKGRNSVYFFSISEFLLRPVRFKFTHKEINADYFHNTYSLRAMKGIGDINDRVADDVSELITKYRNKFPGRDGEREVKKLIRVYWEDNSSLNAKALNKMINNRIHNPSVALV